MLFSLPFQASVKLLFETLQDCAQALQTVGLQQDAWFGFKSPNQKKSKDNKWLKWTRDGNQRTPQ